MKIKRTTRYLNPEFAPHIDTMDTSDFSPVNWVPSAIEQKTLIKVEYTLIGGDTITYEPMEE